MDAFRGLHRPTDRVPIATGLSARRHTHAVETPGVVVGVSGARRNAAVAVAAGDRLVAFCELERITRVRSEGLRAGTAPIETLRAALDTVQRRTADVRAFVTAERGVLLPGDLPQASFDHHFAHAATAALTSPFASCAVLVCDERGDPPVTVWTLDGGRLVNQRWEWKGQGFAGIYSECAQLLGFGDAAEHKLEALARLDCGAGFERLGRYFSYSDGRFQIDSDWTSEVSRWWADAGGIANVAEASRIAGSFQRCIGDGLVELVREVRHRLPYDRLCLGGGLFYNTHFNTRIVESGAFNSVFVPLNPGNAGVAAGAAIARAQGDTLRGVPVSPFLGPGYSNDDIKSTLENCKLTYDYLSEDEVIDTTVQALTKGLLIGWFQGKMEWGHRSLGHRSILANPFAPHVLENLNSYLKQREPYRTYGLSVCEEEAPRHFHVPAASRFMELEYVIREPRTFRNILPEGVHQVRVQTLPSESSLFYRLHRQFGAVAEGGVLVNTSFNGLHEPIVCSPRDAVRVFYGTGLDLLVLGQFVIRK